VCANDAFAFYSNRNYSEGAGPARSNTGRCLRQRLLVRLVKYGRLPWEKPDVAWGQARLSVRLPTYNERDSIRQSMTELLDTGVVDEVLVINNNAASGSSEEIAQAVQHAPLGMVHGVHDRGRAMLPKSNGYCVRPPVITWASANGLELRAVGTQATRSGERPLRVRSGMARARASDR
jgi:hypothetical protein